MLVLLGRTGGGRKARGGGKARVGHHLGRRKLLEVGVMLVREEKKYKSTKVLERKSQSELCSLSGRRDL